MSEWVTPHYWLSATSTASLALSFVGPACAGAGAWEEATRRARISDQNAVRSPLAIAFPLLLPVFVMGLVGMTAALLVSAAAADVGFGMPDPGILAVEAVLLAANTLVGFVLGRLWAPIVAVPVTLIASFVANAYPVSWSIVWIRHLVGGGLQDCCVLDQSLDVWALVSAGAFGTGVCLSAAVLIQYRKSAPAVVAAAALLAGGFVGGVASAHGMGADPVTSRPTGDLVCDHGRPRICLWPEMDDQEGMVRTESRKAVARLRQAGVAVPATLTMADRPGSDETKLAIGPGISARGVPTGVAAGLLPQSPACADNGEPYPAADAYGPVGAWLSLTARRLAPDPHQPGRTAGTRPGPARPQAVPTGPARLVRAQHPRHEILQRNPPAGRQREPRMNWWLKARAVPALSVSVVVTNAVGLLMGDAELPVPVLTGQSGHFLVGHLITLLPAVMLLHGMGRGDLRTEGVACRPVRRWDAALGSAVAVTGAGVAALCYALGADSVALVLGRNIAGYVGLALLLFPFLGHRIAAVTVVIVPLLCAAAAGEAAVAPSHGPGSCTPRTP
ncbi:hypothetical protein ACFQ10_53255 [Streptomyces indonesiensis]